MQGVVYQVIYISIALARIGLVGLELPLAYAAHIFSIFKVLVLVRMLWFRSTPVHMPVRVMQGVVYAASYYLPTQCHMTRPKHGKVNKQTYKF